MPAEQAPGGLEFVPGRRSAATTHDATAPAAATPGGRRRVA
ncbi:hypothetical protein [Promicromonospora sp. NPDC050880]